MTRLQAAPDSRTRLPHCISPPPARSNLPPRPPPSAPGGPPSSQPTHSALRSTRMATDCLNPAPGLGLLRLQQLWHPHRKRKGTPLPRTFHASGCAELSCACALKHLKLKGAGSSTKCSFSCGRACDGRRTRQRAERNFLGYVNRIIFKEYNICYETVKIDYNDHPSK